MNGHTIRRSWSDRAHRGRNLVWYIPALLMFLSLCLQLVAQSEAPHRELVVASRPAAKLVSD